MQNFSKFMTKKNKPKSQEGVKVSKAYQLYLAKSPSH